MNCIMQLQWRIWGGGGGGGGGSRGAKESPLYTQNDINEKHGSVKPSAQILLSYYANARARKLATPRVVAVTSGAVSKSSRSSTG